MNALSYRTMLENIAQIAGESELAMQLETSTTQHDTATAAFRRALLRGDHFAARTALQRMQAAATIIDVILGEHDRRADALVELMLKGEEPTAEPAG